MKQRIIYSTILALLVFNTGCRKYLDKKQRLSLTIPATIEDCQALMENYPYFVTDEAVLTETTADNYYVTNTDYNNLSLEDRNLYIWSPSLTITDNYEYRGAYARIYSYNLVLQTILTVTPGTNNQFAWDNVVGQAYYGRAHHFFNMVNELGEAYKKSTAASKPGIALRLDPDFNTPSVRSSLEASYQQVLSDAKNAAEHLPLQPLHSVRPCRATALALVARTYLAMGEYDSCLVYSEKALQLRSGLLDYNLVVASSNLPFQPFVFPLNPEVLHETSLLYSDPIISTKGKIDSTLYNSYASNDLRKTVFFKSNNNGTYGFKGSYLGANFNGPAVDELYLMRAECQARLGNTVVAMQDLNTLLVKRWKTGTFIPYTAADNADALAKILMERRKELIFRGLRLMDLKRYNRDGANITLRRIINNTVYTLPPNDPRYLLPLPESVISLSSMPQNPR